MFRECSTPPLPPMFHMSHFTILHVICHMSGVTCHILCITSNVSHVTIFSCLEQLYKSSCLLVRPSIGWSVCPSVRQSVSPMKLKNSNWDKTQKLKLLWNSKTQILDKLKDSMCDKTKNSNCDETQKCKMQVNLKTQIVTKPNTQKSKTQIVAKLKNSNLDKTQIVTKLNNSKCNKTKTVTKLKLWQN